MPAKHTLHVALTDPLVRYVRGRVADGHHPSASHVVRLALELLIDRETLAATDAASSCPRTERRARV